MQKNNKNKSIPGWFPQIREVVSPDLGIKIADFFEFTMIADRIEASPERYKDFIFDGCSFLPDELLGLFTGCNWKDITYWSCLPHDIMYAYGEPGNAKERKTADWLFRNNLINASGMKRWLAEVFFKAVEIGGGEEFEISNVSWGFATKKGKEEWV